jgi:hypothetical protein
MDAEGAIIIGFVFLLSRLLEPRFEINFVERGIPFFRGIIIKFGDNALRIKILMHIRKILMLSLITSWLSSIHRLINNSCDLLNNKVRTTVKFS